MRALILQFEADNPPEHLGTRLTERGVAWDVVRMDLPHLPLSLEGYDMLVALGGSMNVDMVDQFPFLEEARETVREAVARNLPYLGICLGGQMLARALGAKVRQASAPEIGVVPVKLNSSDDPLLRGLGPVLQTVHFHEDTFAVPDSGVLLASSAGCATQIVRCAEHAYALQFHPEVSFQTFAGWIDVAYAAVTGDADPHVARSLVDDVRAQDATIRIQARILADNFIEIAARSRPVESASTVSS